MRLIIHHPEKQSTKQRWALGLITAVFWAFWIYLWIPLVSLLAWVLGFRIFEYQMIELGGYRGLLELLGLYLAVIGLLGGALIGWAAYNIHRFGKASGRRSSPLISAEIQAQHFNVDAQQLEEWRKSQRLVIDHGEHSRIASVSMS